MTSTIQDCGFPIFSLRSLNTQFMYISFTQRKILERLKNNNLSTNKRYLL